MGKKMMSRGNSGKQVATKSKKPKMGGGPAMQSATPPAMDPIASGSPGGAPGGGAMGFKKGGLVKAMGIHRKGGGCERKR